MEHRPYDCSITEKPQILCLLCALKWHHVIQGWLKSFEEEAKSAFPLLSVRWQDCVIIPQLNLAYVGKGIISSLKTNLNRPNLKAAFVCNLIKRVMTVSHAKQRESKRKSETLNSAEHSHIRVLLICKLSTQGKKKKNRNGLVSFHFLILSLGHPGKPKRLRNDLVSETCNCYFQGFSVLNCKMGILMSIIIMIGWL